MRAGSIYHWNQELETDGKDREYIWITFDGGGSEEKADNVKTRISQLEDDLKELKKRRDDQADGGKKENERKEVNADYLSAESELRQARANYSRFSEAVETARHNQNIRFKITRLKDVYSRKEALCIEIFRDDKPDGRLLSSSQKIGEDIYELEEYGICMTPPCFDSLARCIRKVYFDLIPQEREYIQNDVPEAAVKQFVKSCIVQWEEEKDAVRDTDGSLICVPVAKIKEWYNDSSCRQFSLTDIKEALSIYGYTKTNAGRNDYTVSGLGKVIAFWKDKIEETAGEMESEHENG